MKMSEDSRCTDNRCEKNAFRIFSCSDSTSAILIHFHFLSLGTGGERGGGVLDKLIIDGIVS